MTQNLVQKEHDARRTHVGLFSERNIVDHLSVSANALLELELSEALICDKFVDRARYTV